MLVKKEFSEEELDVCKNTDLVSLCNYLGYRTKRVGNYFTLESMDSVRIKNRRTYHRYSNDTGGTAIDFLMNEEGMGFKDAVRYLLDYNNVPREVPEYQRRTGISKPPIKSRATKAAPPAEELPPKLFRLPNANRQYDRIYKYLCEDRYLSRETVDFFVERRLIYESVKTHNVVFVGRDPNGVARHASLRGTYNPKDGKPFKGVLTGSNPEYSFSFVSPESSYLVVCEAPIDCMSVFDISIGGANDVPYNYLALTGTHDRALERFLLDHPHVKTIWLGLDADEPGQAAADKYVEKYTSGTWAERKFNIEKIPPVSPSNGVFCKDWNETLREWRREELEYRCKKAMEETGALPVDLKRQLQEKKFVFDPERLVVICDKKECREMSQPIAETELPRRAMRR